MSDEERLRIRAAKASKMAQQWDRSIRFGYMAARKERGLTQSEVAERLGWRTTLVSNFEQGRTRLTPGRFAAMCRLGTDVDPVQIYRKVLLD